MLSKSQMKGTTFLQKLVKSRIIFSHDFKCAESKYHSVCYVNFLKLKPSAAQNIHQDSLRVLAAMNEIFNYLGNKRRPTIYIKRATDGVRTR